jgi:hypothetical protein
MTDAKKEASTDNRLQRFNDLDRRLHDAVAWAGMLDDAIERIDRFPSLTRDEMNIACRQLNLVADALKEAIEQMDAIYHNRTKEEAAQ